MKNAWVLMLTGLLAFTACSEKKEDEEKAPVVPASLKTVSPSLEEIIPQERLTTIRNSFGALKILKAASLAFDSESSSEADKIRREQLSKASQEEKDFVQSLKDRCVLKGPKTIKTGADKPKTGAIVLTSRLSSITGPTCPIEQIISRTDKTKYDSVVQDQSKKGHWNGELTTKILVRDFALAKKTGAYGLEVTSSLSGAFEEKTGSLKSYMRFQGSGFTRFMTGKVPMTFEIQYLHKIADDVTTFEKTMTLKMNYFGTPIEVVSRERTQGDKTEVQGYLNGLLITKEELEESFGGGLNLGSED